MNRIAAVMSVLLVACAPAESDRPPTTPRITAGATEPSLSELLPTLADVRNATGAPNDLREAPVQNAELYENPDPRGFCGAKIEQPSFSDAVIKSFESPSVPVIVLAAAWDLPGREATRYFNGYNKDSHPGCGPYTSDTPFHAKQRVVPLSTAALDGIGDGALVQTIKARVGDQQESYAGLVLIQHEQIFLLVMTLSAVPPPEAFLRGVAEAIGDRLPTDPG